VEFIRLVLNCMVVSYELVEKMAAHAEFSSPPLGDGRGIFVRRCFSRPALAACLLLTLLSPSLEDEGRKPVSGNEAALGGAFPWLKLCGRRGGSRLESIATK